MLEKQSKQHPSYLFCAKNLKNKPKYFQLIDKIVLLRRMTKVLKFILPLLLIFVAEQTSARISDKNIDRELKSTSEWNNEQNSSNDFKRDIEFPCNEYSTEKTPERGEFSRPTRSHQHFSQLSFKKISYRIYIQRKHFPTVCKNKPYYISIPFDYQTSCEYYVFALRHIVI